MLNKIPKQNHRNILTSANEVYTIFCRGFNATDVVVATCADNRIGLFRMRGQNK